MKLLLSLFNTTILASYCGKCTCGKTLSNAFVCIQMVKNRLGTPTQDIFHHLKQDTQEFHRKYVVVPADKAASHVVVV